MNIAAKTLIIAIATASTGACTANSGEQHVELKFSGGYTTDSRDHGRPVKLIASALGVPCEVFRRAFSGVNPARDHRPSGDEQRQNKEALLSVLGPYGITNDRLDAVSDFYRYNAQEEDLWKHESAAGYAIVVKGKVTGFKLTNPGFGYTAPPTVTIPGFTATTPIVKLKFSQDCYSNGSVASISIKHP
jgi:hypothetical protein